MIFLLNKSQFRLNLQNMVLTYYGIRWTENLVNLQWKLLKLHNSKLKSRIMLPYVSTRFCNSEQNCFTKIDKEMLMCIHSKCLSKLIIKMAEILVCSYRCDFLSPFGTYQRMALCWNWHYSHNHCISNDMCCSIRTESLTGADTSDAITQYYQFMSATRL